MQASIETVGSASAFLVASQAFGQSYIGRYDAYAGFVYLDSPHIDLGPGPGTRLDSITA
jgi:hypothetical protein